MATMNINTFNTNTLSIPFFLNFPLDLRSPANFLSSYRKMLGNKKPTRNEALLKTTERYVKTYHKAEKDLLDLELRSSSFFGWFALNNKIRKARIALSETKKRLMNWVSSTLAFFNL